MTAPDRAFPTPVDKFFAAKVGDQIDEAVACFADDATVWDHGEDLEMRGFSQIRSWMSRTDTDYQLTYDVRSGETRGTEFIASVIVSGDFPGSPYEFAYRFKLSGDAIAELAIEPIGSLAP